MTNQNTSSTEVYTFSQLCDILALTPKELRKLFRSEKLTPDYHLWQLMLGTATVEATHLVSYLAANPDVLKALQDRYVVMLSHGDEKLDMIRHVLMLEAYYEQYGYLV